MSLSLIDFHCDTLYEAYITQQSLTSNKLAVSQDKAACFDKYIQVAAIWSDKHLGDNEAFEQYLKITEYLDLQCKIYTDRLGIYNNTLDDANNGKMLLIPAVEDARILAGKTERLDVLRQHGTRILTLMWQGKSCIGGAYDTNDGLTDFGKAIVSRCFEIGITPDISHASEKSAYDVFLLNDKNLPVIASHSNSYSVYPHKRNLSDSLFSQIMKCHGLVGLNLYREHLGDPPYTDTILRHIEHWLSLGGENNICLGCDFDGAETPDEYNNISNLKKLYDAMAEHNYSQIVTEKLFWQNAARYINNNFNS